MRNSRELEQNSKMHMRVMYARDNWLV